MYNDTYLDAPVSPRSFSSWLSKSASLSLWIMSNYDSLILKKTKSDIKPTATNNCELTLSPGGPLGPGGPSSP